MFPLLKFSTMLAVLLICCDTSMLNDMFLYNIDLFDFHHRDYSATFWRSEAHDSSLAIPLMRELCNNLHTANGRNRYRAINGNDYARPLFIHESSSSLTSADLSLEFLFFLVRFRYVVGRSTSIATFIRSAHVEPRIPISRTLPNADKPVCGRATKLGIELWLNRVTRDEFTQPEFTSLSPNRCLKSAFRSKAERIGGYYTSEFFILHNFYELKQVRLWRKND